MFQLVFKGECVPGTDPAAVRNNAKALFKASAEQLDRMFSGQPVVIRNKLEQVQAEKYQAVLKKHGMVAYVKPMAGSGLSLDPPGVTLVEHQEAEAPMFEHLDDWTLAPPGTDLGVDRVVPPPVVPDISHLSLADDDKKKH